ncbi:MAG: methionine gamma-lyase family protein [Oscillospiraceae bacterium]|nr:methionine gamma-lyase family protein [Oscillospiraceae bacterium]
MRNYSCKAKELVERAERGLSAQFAVFDGIAAANTERVLDAFQARRVSDAHFAGSTGYGLGDAGRDVFDGVVADVFGKESAIARVQLSSGTHTIATALFGVLRPGDTLVSAAGAPYDTLHGVIRRLAEFGVKYRELELTPEGLPDLDGLADAVRDAKAVLIQRSGGYSGRRALDTGKVSEIIEIIRGINKNAVTLVDNCYCEFVETREPDGDLIMGSFIKNPGGGLAPTGGYIAGRSDLVEAAALNLTAVGAENGASLGVNRLMFQGFFLAPHVVAQALKTAALAAAALSELGYGVSPSALEKRSDIVQAIRFGDAETLLRFCRGIQAGSPVDSFAVPEPSEMPGYDCGVVMAAGTFVQGGSVELSCDAPMREPYTAFLQGGLTYEAGRLGVIAGVGQLTDNS